MKILHVSDFHIVSDATFALVEDLNRKLEGSGLALPDLRLSAADRDSILQLFARDPRQSRSYDAVVFSGDATTFGDDSSMREAAGFLREIARHALRPDCIQNIVAVPGNHDVLEHGLRVLLADLSQYLGPIGNTLVGFANSELKAARAALQKWLDSLTVDGAIPLESKQIANFGEFIGYRFNSAFHYAQLVSLKDEVRPLKIEGKSGAGTDLAMNIFPINTLPSAAALTNMGVVSAAMRENIQYAKGTIQPARDGAGVLNIAVTHHGFMPLSELPVIRQRGDKTNLLAVLEHSLSSQFNGYQLGSTLQDAGFDCHLHGHEHRNTAVQFDFDLATQGSIASVGAGSIAAPHGHAPSFNVLEFPNEFCMTVTSMVYQTQTARFLAEMASHVFDTRGKGPTTRLARDEITRLFLTDRDGLGNADPVIDSTSFEHECDALLFESGSGMFAFGVRLQKLRNRLRAIARDGSAEQKQRLRDRITGAGFDILVVAPMPNEVHAYDKKISPSNEDLIELWRDCLRDVAEHLRVDFDALHGKVRIRATKVPIAHAGHVKFQRRPEGEDAQPQFIRGLIQIIKVVEEYDSDVFLELSYRTNRGLLKYYAGSAWNLWAKAAPLKLWSERIAAD